MTPFRRKKASPVATVFTGDSRGPRKLEQIHISLSTFVSRGHFQVIVNKGLNLSMSSGRKPSQLTLEWHRFELWGSAYTWVFFYSKYSSTGASQVALVVKNLPANASAGDVRGTGLIPSHYRVPCLHAPHSIRIPDFPIWERSLQCIPALSLSRASISASAS